MTQQPPSFEPRGQHLHFDCASGAAGDMMLGALIDLGVPLDVIGEALDAIGAGRQRVMLAKIVKHGIAAIDIKVDTTGHILDAHQHTHTHHGPQQPTRGTTPAAGVPHHHPRPGTPPPVRRAATESGSASGSGKFVGIKFRAETHERHVHVDALGDKVEEVLEYPGAQPQPHAHAHAHYLYADIRWRIARAPLREGTRMRALDIFDRLARAEAKLHGTTIDEVQLHEVGAIDSIVDVVGTAAALDWLQPASVTCAAVAMGHGTLTSAHGTLPVPAPAALEVLREAQGVMMDGGLPRELCTPTGAAILAHAVTSWSPSPPGRALAVGWGAGDTDLADRPNVLRATLLAPVTSASGAAVSKGDTVWQIDANLDDMSPELCGPASDALFAAGALDVWWTPITMKKGRPALTLSALVELPRRDAVISSMLRETTTIGVRFTELQRTVLTRKLIEVETRYGIIPVKVAVDGNTILNAAPEYEACAKAARVHQVPVKLVYSAALAAYDARRP
ncbi:MAG TPA: nickel pincer cofactor biosynthesis protein LarC [Kofleriaceae bacterium]|nr:nickel pincer cofactor biosynthesis protein LarC [Kofleriaceae bacterium]